MISDFVIKVSQLKGFIKQIVSEMLIGRGELYLLTNKMNKKRALRGPYQKLTTCVVTLMLS